MGSVAKAVAAPGAPGRDVNSLLAQLRNLTAPYHYITGTSVTIPGLGTYEAASPCDEQMGIHYVNYALASDLVVNELTPEILLYVPEGGGFRLVGVEYFMVAIGTYGTYTGPWFGMELPAGWAWLGTTPTLYGRPMDGPMEPHAPGMPWHFDFHAYIWVANPEGIFEEWNPNVKC